MREVEQSDISYSTDQELCSVFVGSCPSRELFEQYWEKDYDLLWDDCIGFEMGVDFGINTYDEDFAVMVLQKEPTDQIDELVKDAETFDIDALKKTYPEGLDRQYNAVIVLHRMSYDGHIKEVENKSFGYFRFLGVFESF
ncbi:MAG: immunity 22 family protein [Ruminiclostridium sp.]|nr:immunity 22 family protein [Ruminiclostridium sp.]